MNLTDRLLAAVLDPTLTARVRRDAGERWLQATHPPRAPELAGYRAEHELAVVEVVLYFFAHPDRRDEPIPGPALTVGKDKV
jgi:hypothetical protein